MIIKVSIKPSGPLVLNAKGEDALPELIGNLYFQRAIKGDKGDKGDPGAEGPKGEKGDTPDLSPYAKKTDVPGKTSQLANDSGYITKSVSDLANYYLKTQTYTRDEVQALVAGIKTASFETVDTLPATGKDNVIYLVPKRTRSGNLYDEYLWIGGAWELIGDTAVDISGKLDKTGDASDTTVTFVPETGELESGAKQKTLWGRIAKKIADIVSGAIAVGKANFANNLRSNKNFYLDYDGTDGTETPYVILGATGTDNYNQSTIKRIRPANLTVGHATKADQDGNGLNIPANYTRKTYIRPGSTWSAVGWHRIYTSGASNNPGENIDLNIITYYNYDRPQNISLRVCVGYGMVQVIQQNAFFDTPISKIRVVQKGNSIFYIDAYMKDSRGVWVYLNQFGGTGALAETDILNPAIEDGYAATEYAIIAGDRIAQKSDLPTVTYSVDPPANPKNGDIHIVPTD